MTIETQLPSATLYYKAGGSDKIYSVRIEPQGDGFVVAFAYGRRGSTLQSGVKTATPVSFDAAEKIFQRLVREKTAKGYTPGEDGTPYQQTVREERATGILPQLLNPIDESKAERLIADPAWLAQEKLDGKRVLIKRVGDEILGINRKGLTIALPEPIVSFACGLGPQQWLMDSECVGDVLVVFDLLEHACINLRPQPYNKRLKMLYEMPIADHRQPIRFIETATTAPAKRQLLARLREQKREGIVFKRLVAPYTPGRPASGGDQLKLKFTATASCIVAGTNGSKRSVKLELLDGGNRVGVGSVTVPVNHPIPPKDSVIEARYLYANVGGALYQPVYLGRRDDIAVAECNVTQLKFKSGSSDDEG